MTVIAMSLCAQEIWNANAVTDLKTAEQTIEATPSITLKIASVLNEKDIEDGKNPWMLEGKEDGSSNTALNTTDCTPPFNQFLKGMGKQGSRIINNRAEEADAKGAYPGLKIGDIGGNWNKSPTTTSEIPPKGAFLFNAF